MHWIHRITNLLKQVDVSSFLFVFKDLLAHDENFNCRAPVLNRGRFMSSFFYINDPLIIS